MAASSRFRRQRLIALAGPALVAMLAAGCGSYDLQFEQACQRQGIERGDPRFETCVTERRADWERRLSRSFPSRGGGP